MPIILIAEVISLSNRPTKSRTQKSEVWLVKTGGACDFIRFGIEFLKEMGAVDETKFDCEIEHQQGRV